MQSYVTLRRNGWATAQDLAAAADRSGAEGDQMPDDIRWIRSYVTAETDGSVCIYRIALPEALRDRSAYRELNAGTAVAA
jgi:hypothetical protein